ncbi:MAG: hypothetical protein K9W46_02685 [Candidatus Heimdallarchaeum endolithica]|uniref:Peptidase M20 dimerisation domain-containing protein n=1 Tax=Candidatus Heimdallarchaeum endolithica TaxID=2876572 RepID=A0A9Y1FPF6_9ARCH|nr:MAG: hypothetical protein K9W46_02685 [Candidatus Heimdallarchaeum endolithica]
MNIEKIYSKIREDFETKHIEEIRRFIRQPSVSADGNGIEKMTEMLMKKIVHLGGENVHLVDLTKGEFGHPIVYGEIIQDETRPTILFYSMYDVQPVFPEKWVYEPDLKNNIVDFRDWKKVEKFANDFIELIRD